MYILDIEICKNIFFTYFLHSNIFIYMFLQVIVRYTLLFFLIIIIWTI